MGDKKSPSNEFNIHIRRISSDEKIPKLLASRSKSTHKLPTFSRQTSQSNIIPLPVPLPQQSSQKTLHISRDILQGIKKTPYYYLANKRSSLNAQINTGPSLSNEKVTPLSKIRSQSQPEVAVPTTVSNSEIKEVTQVKPRFVKISRDSHSITSKAVTPFEANLLENARKRLLFRKQGDTLRKATSSTRLAPMSYQEISTRGASFSKNLDTTMNSKIQETEENLKPIELPNNFFNMIDETKRDLEKEKKEIAEIIDKQNQEIENIHEKYFRPKAKVKRLFAVLGKPPPVPFVKLYSTNKTGFLYFKKKLMTSDYIV